MVGEFRNRLDLLDAMPQGGIVAEVGVQRGDFAEEILSRCAPRLLLLIDAWQHVPDGSYAIDKSNVSQDEHDRFYAVVCARFSAEIAAGTVIVLRGPSEVVLPQLPDRWLDWIYLDGDHTLDAMRRDLASCDRIVKGTGFIAGHDYVENDAAGFGVVPAVAEFCPTRHWRLVARTLNDDVCDGYDSYVLSQHGPPKKETTMTTTDRPTVSTDGPDQTPPPRVGVWTQFWRWLSGGRRPPRNRPRPGLSSPDDRDRSIYPLW